MSVCVTSFIFYLCVLINGLSGVSFNSPQPTTNSCSTGSDENASANIEQAWH
jgi:hypothetical protein